MALRTIEGFDIDFQRKKIKKMHLRIRKDGSILLTVPMRAPEQDIVKFVSDESEWIRSHQSRILDLCESREHMYDDGSTVYVLGRPFTLKIKNGSRAAVTVSNDIIEMTVNDDCTFNDREKIMNEFYRRILKERLSVLVPEWEERTGLHCSGWQTKIMSTRWGTCNTRTKKIWFSVRLCEKPEDLIEYVIVHELAHTLVGNHGPEFKRLLDVYIPDWREKRKRLNSVSC